MNELVISSSDNDSQEVKDTVSNLIKKFLGAIAKVFHEYGHFTRRVLTDGRFPELLEAIIPKNA